LKSMRKVYSKLFGLQFTRPECDHNPDSVSQKIHTVLMADKPCMIARFGATEMSVLLNYMGVMAGRRIIPYIKSEAFDWWWNPKTLDPFNSISGFFPLTEKYLNQFGELFFQDIETLDIVGSWLESENHLADKLQKVQKVSRGMMDPFWSSDPWTKVLEGKKVLVVHPFSETIKKQYANRDKLFKHKVLPTFELKTLKSVVSHAGENTQFNNWFVALEYMKTEIDTTDYDICLIGAGAYGFHLAAHVKRMGKKSVHLGGSLQLLFGIKGKRWVAVAG
jgi:hypothetical protein